jgi:hypothetical protein
MSGLKVDILEYHYVLLELYHVQSRHWQWSVKHIFGEKNKFSPSLPYPMFAKTWINPL